MNARPPSADGGSVGFVEHVALVPSPAGDLAGVLAHPASDAPRVAMLIIVGGPQYRVGSHRLFVQLARSCAAAGAAVLRFDVGGMGDGPGQAQDFTSLSTDVGAAVDTLAARVRPGTPIVLWGLCDGASAALLYLARTADKRIAGLCLCNPWVRSDASHAVTQVKHYYTERLRSADFWRKLLRGQVAMKAMAELAATVRRMRSPAGPASAEGAYQDHMLTGWQRFSGPTLLVLSEHDLTAKEFVEYAAARDTWQRTLGRPSIRQVMIAGADHTFSSTPAKRALLDSTLVWLDSLAPG